MHENTKEQGEQGERGTTQIFDSVVLLLSKNNKNDKNNTHKQEGIKAYRNRTSGLLDHQDGNDQSMEHSGTDGMGPRCYCATARKQEVNCLWSTERNQEVQGECQELVRHVNRRS